MFRGHQFRFTCSRKSSLWDKEEVRRFLEKDRCFQDLTVDMYDKLIKSDSDRNIIQEVLNTYESEKYETGMVPAKLTMYQMGKILAMEPGFDITKYLHVLFKYEIYQHLRGCSKDTMGKDLRGFTLSAIYYDERTGMPYYGSWRNSYLIRLRHRELKMASVFRATAAQQFNQRLILDCGWDHKPENVSSVAHQLANCAQRNFNYPEPFKLSITSFDPNSSLGKMYKFVREFPPNVNDLIDYREGDFLDHFSREKLVYLSPYAAHYLENFDPKATYIIGCYSAIGDRVSLKKCLKYKIPNFRFPLDKYITLRMSRILSASLSTTIITHFKNCGSIEDSVRQCVPRHYKQTDSYLNYVQKDRFNRMGNYKRNERIAGLLLDKGKDD